MAKSELEVDLDSFNLEAPQPVGKVDANELKEKIGNQTSDGEVKTFSKIEKDVIESLDKQVETLLNGIADAKVDSKELKDIENALSKIGDHEIDKSSQISNKMLQRPLRAMRQNDSSNSKSIANSMKQLRMKVTDLDPKRKGNLLGRKKIFGIPVPFGIGNKISSYMQDFKNSESQINEIIQSLMNGKDELLEDNAIIEVERQNLFALMQRLEQYAYIAKKLDGEVTKYIESLSSEDSNKISIVRQDILFPLRQKSMDIYQHLAVCMQGYMALQVVKKNNDELIRGVDRATKTTVSALRTAVLVSEALGTQKLVLQQVQTVNDVTNELIKNNADMLGQQGNEIQQNAAKTNIDIQNLNEAFTKIFKAMDAIDNYREQALPNMKKTVDMLENSVSEAKKYLDRNRNAKVETNKEEADDGKVVKLV